MKLLPFLPAMAALLCAAVSVPVQADDFDSAGVRIHYEVQGQGSPVVLIHGLYSSARMNWDLPGITKELAKSYQVVALDARGHGQSDVPQGEGQYGVQMVEDVVRLMDHLRIPKARIAGYSMGGMIALKMAVTHPDRVESVVLGGMGWLQTGSALQEVWANLGGRQASGTPPACVRGFSEFAVSAAEVKAVRIPVTIIAGDRDPCRKLYIEPLARIRPDWPVEIIAGAGHITCVMKPEFKAQLKAAIDRNGAQR